MQGWSSGKKPRNPCIIFNKEDFYDTAKVLTDLKKYKVDFVILAGFLWLLPKDLINNYPKKLLIYTLPYFQNTVEKECTVCMCMKPLLLTMKLNPV